jgi:aspartate 1-decarboxylase
MLRFFCKSKIHGATVTDTNLRYEGSITIDEDLLVAADILSFEQVQVVNLNNGERFETYVIRGRAGSGEIQLNGPAARLGQAGDVVHIISYVLIDSEETSFHEPKFIFVDALNRLKPDKNSQVGTDNR